MALRYAYGPNGWGLDPRGSFRTPHELGRWFGLDERGYDPLRFERYETPYSRFLYTGWTDGSLETRTGYSKDFLGNYYQDPNGRFWSTRLHDTTASSIRGTVVPNIREFTDDDDDGL